ncbi:type II secretion system F family protein [Paludibacterium paludis]|uniref:Type II secretion system protein F n=1 Tax=Paludibacterium paludis TaxID=1225769 RepID=A0A918P0D0_9NEIS|nr:type II secretion system F family protein [Paludibacterium paludis]GGY08209.1 type II secretion system protein F [Paludibacterium paludis]
MSRAATRKPSSGGIWVWEGKDRAGKKVGGETRAESATLARAQLRRQGIAVSRIRRRRVTFGDRIGPKDIALFTRQLATLMKAGVPLLQAFDIAARGASKPSMTRLLLDVRMDVETGQSLAESFRRHPRHFDELYCNVVAAGETGGVLEALLDKLARYQEKTLMLKRKVKSAMIYPALVLLAGLGVTSIILIFVIPSFKDLFASFGAELPGPTRLVMTLSDAFVALRWVLAAGLVGGAFAIRQLFQRSQAFRDRIDRLTLRLPVLGNIVTKAAVARWSRTLATLFAAGVPLVEALESVAGAAGNKVFADATRMIQQDVSKGSSLSASMQRTDCFPVMVLQMTTIGEEAGMVDDMLNKIADFYEEEVDNAVAVLSSLIEPFIIVVLGVLVGGLMIAMYLPIFDMGKIV